MHITIVVPRGLEPRTLRLLVVRYNQLSYETHWLRSDPWVCKSFWAEGLQVFSAMRPTRKPNFYTILFFGSPPQRWWLKCKEVVRRGWKEYYSSGPRHKGDGSSAKKLCKEVGKNFRPRLGRSGRASSVRKEATESRPQGLKASKPRGRPRGRPQGRPRGSPRGRRSLNTRLSLKATRQAARHASRQARQPSRQASKPQCTKPQRTKPQCKAQKPWHTLRQASVASLGHGLQAEERRANEARYKRPLANKNDSCGVWAHAVYTSGTWVHPLRPLAQTVAACRADLKRSKFTSHFDICLQCRLKGLARSPRRRRKEVPEHFWQPWQWSSYSSQQGHVNKDARKQRCT